MEKLEERKHELQRRSSIPQSFSSETKLTIDNKNDTPCLGDVASQGATAETRMAGGVDQADGRAVRGVLSLLLIEHELPFEVESDPVLDHARHRFDPVGSVDQTGP